MKWLPLIVLAGGLGCTGLAGLDGDYVVGDTATGSSSTSGTGGSTSGTGGTGGSTSGTGGSGLTGGTTSGTGGSGLTGGTGGTGGSTSGTGGSGLTGGSTSGTGGSGLTGGSGTGGVGGKPPPTCKDLKPPDGPPAQCSQSASNGAALSVQNNCVAMTVEVFWVAYNCGEQYYGSAAPGQTFTISSYDTHPWRVRSQMNGQLLLDIPPLQGNTSVSVP